MGNSLLHTHSQVSQQQLQQAPSMFDLLPGPPLNFCTSPPLEALKPNRTHILMQHQQQQQQQQGGPGGRRTMDMDDTENMVVDAGDKNQSTNRRLSGPITSSSSAKYGNNCPGFKPTAVMRRSFRTDPMNNNNNNSNNTNNHNNGQSCNHNERWTVVGTEPAGAPDNPNGDDGDSEVERFNFEGIQISYSSPSLMDMRSVSPPAAKLFRRPLKHHNHQRMQRLQRPCLDFDKMQQVNI